MAIMNASTVWHWGQGDHDADFYDREEQNTENLALEGASNLFEPPYELEGGDAMDDGKLRLLSNSSTSSHLALYGAGGGLGSIGKEAGSSMAAFEAEKARAQTKREIIGSEAVRKSAMLVPRAAEDCLSNEKLHPVDSGRGFALLEKMGWKKGQGLGRNGSGTVLPVAAPIKSDMGGLASKDERYGVAPKLMSANGPELEDANFQVGTSSMLAAAKAASMNSEFSNIVSQTKSVQQINAENRLTAMGLPAMASAPATPNSTPSRAYGLPTIGSRPCVPAPPLASIPAPTVPTVPVIHSAVGAMRPPWSAITVGKMHQVDVKQRYVIQPQDYQTPPHSACSVPMPYGFMPAYGMEQPPSYVTQRPEYNFPPQTSPLPPCYNLPNYSSRADAGAHNGYPSYR